MKNKIWVVVFFFVTFLLILPPKDTRDDGFHSSELTVQTIDTATRKISVYTDETGRIVKPANIGYSVIIIDKDADGRDVLERYFLTKKVRTFDELSAVELTAAEKMLLPEKQWGKQYGVSREFNEAGECVSYTYLNKQGKPMNIVSGYSTVRQEFDEFHRKIKETYYSVTGEQVANTSGNWGQAYTYYSSDEAAVGMTEPEEPTISWLIETVTYLNKSGGPVWSGSGFEVVRRFYGEDKRTKRELFYDASGKQVANGLGAYGQEYTYDDLGRQITCTYLDKECMPASCNKGYSKVVRTFFKNSAVKTEMYYTADGTLAKLAHGESGIYEKNTATQYLNADGKVMLILDNFLRGNPLLVIAFAVLIWGVSSRLTRKWNMVLLFAYIIFILYMTLLSREAMDEAIKLDFLESALALVDSHYMRVQFIENIYLFLPFGVVLYRITGSKKLILLGFLFSGCIELIQYISRLGSAEVMDVLSNGVGAVIGAGMGTISNSENTVVEKNS